MVDNIRIETKKTITQLQIIRKHHQSSQRKHIPFSEKFIRDLFQEITTHSDRTYHFYKATADTQGNSLSPYQHEAIAQIHKKPHSLYIKKDTINQKEILRIVSKDFLNTKKDDTSQMIEIIVPIDKIVQSNKKIRNSILFLLSVLFLIILIILAKFLMKNERYLQKEIHSKSRELKTLTSLINDKMISLKLTPQGMITSVSNSLVEISGYSRYELIGKRHTILHHSKESRTQYKAMWSVISSGNPWSGKILNRTKNGNKYYIYSTIFPSLDYDGKITEYTSFSEDITKQVLVENKLNNDRIFSQTVFEKQDEILIISNLLGHIVNINQKFFSMFDYNDLDDFFKQHSSICELFLAKDGYLLQSNGSKHWSAIVINHPKESHKVRMRDKKGDIHIFKVHIKEIKVEDQRYNLASFTDVTQLEQARELAESSEKSKASFMANMSHEIRTPLNGINGFVQLLAKTALDTQQARYISLIQTSSKNLIGIVNDILDFSKIESGKMNLSLTQIDPFKELHAILDTFSLKTKEKKILYRTHIDTTIPQLISIDTLRITQILTNLIGNAIKFTPEGGNIEVSVDRIHTEEEKLSLKFTVKDTGIGIPLSRQKSIFEAFTQADDSTTREFGGTGLGLNISVSLIELMGGTLALTSKEGQGSTFSFAISLDILQDQEKTHIETLALIDIEEPKEKRTVKMKSHILVVEDNEMNKILMEELLKDFHLDVDYAVNGKEAIFQVSQTLYDLVFMDINMPIMNGVDATKEIRKMGSKVPIIALTANALEGDAYRFLQAGMTDYISKPVEYDIIASVLQKYID